MRTLATIFFICLLTLLFAGTLSAQWVQTSLDSVQVGCFAINGMNLFAATMDSGVFLSTNNGTSWTAVNNGLPTTWLYVQSLSVSDNNLFAGGSAGVFLSTNNGTSWTATGLGGFCNIGAIASFGANVFAGTSGGDLCNGHVLRSTNYGIDWTEVLYLGRRPVNTLAILGGQIYVGTWDNGLLATSDTGLTWTTKNVGLEGGSVGALAMNDSNFFAGTYNGIFLSTNSGTSWTAVSEGLPYDSTYLHHATTFSFAVSDSAVFAGTQFGVFLTTNNGANWTSTSSGLSDSNIHALAIHDSYLFAGTDSGVWRCPLSEMITTTTIEMSNGWNMASLPLTVSDPRKTVVYPTANSSAFAFDQTAGYVVRDTLNYGEGYWLKFPSPQNIPLTGYPILRDTINVTGGWNLMGSISGAVAVDSIGSIPGGIVTGEFYTYAPTGYQVANTITPGKGYWVKVTQAGSLVLSSIPPPMQKIRIVATGEMPPAPPGEVMAENKVEKPREFALGQNYPNPFNPTTSIKFEVPSSKVVTLKVFDVLGREVATLVSEVKEPGTYTVQWDASGVSSGVYFCRLRAGEFVQTKRMIVVK